MRYFIFIFLLSLFACENKTNQAPLYDYDVEEKLIELNITLSDTKLPDGIPIALAVREGNLIYLSGTGPRNAAGEKVVGKVGIDLSIEEGYEAARLSGIRHLSVLKAEIGDLNKVVKVVKVMGMVNADSSFVDHPKVINGYSELMLEVFGERGKHARSAVGMSSLPFNFACEVEAIVEISD